VCQAPPTSAGGVITVRWNYTHTGGLDLTQVVITATRGVETTQLDVPNGNLTDLFQMNLGVATFTAGFEYTFTVIAYNELGPGTTVCDHVTHLIGRMCFCVSVQSGSVYTIASFPQSSLIACSVQRKKRWRLGN